MWVVDRLRSFFDDDTEEYGPFNLPPRVRVDIDRRTALIGQYYGLNSTDAHQTASILADRLDASRYSPREIITRVDAAVDADSDLVETIVNQQVCSVQTEDAIRRYTESTIEIEVEWMPPGGGNISSVCGDAVGEIEARGGSVSLEELHTIFTESARNHPEGTPDLMTCWVPHEGPCRCSIAPVPP